MNADVLIARFRQYYGHTNFRDEQFTEWEYTYKKERGRQMREEWLSREVLEELVAQEEWGEICQRAVRSFADEPVRVWLVGVDIGERLRESIQVFVRQVEAIS